jgi:hypothetical protein
MLLAGLVVVCNAPTAFGPFIGAIYIGFSGGISALALALAGRNSVESLAQGNGVKGAVASLLTDAKPGEKLP